MNAFQFFENVQGKPFGNRVVQRDAKDVQSRKMTDQFQSIPPICFKFSSASDGGVVWKGQNG